jgi:hypothetical protein
MHAMKSRWFRTGTLAVSACVAVVAWSAMSGPGYQQTFSDLGRDTQLPLERFALDSTDSPEPATAEPPGNRRISMSGYVRRDGRRDEPARHRSPACVRSFCRTIDDAKYWT